MKRPGYSGILKIIATVAVGSVIYAAALTIRSAVFGTAGGLIPLLDFIFTMLLGHFAGHMFLRGVPVFAIKASASKPVKFISFMLNLKDAARSVSSMIAWMFSLLPLFASLAVFMKYGAWRTIFELVFIMAAYVVAAKHSQRSFAQIMTNNAAYAGFVVLASCLEAANLLKILAHLKPWLFGTAYFFILSYLLVKNQEDIDSNIFDKKHVEKSMLPRNLRRFNTFWVCLLFLAVVLFFNLKPIVVYLLKLLRNALIYAAAFFAWLAGHLFGSTGGTQQGSPSGGFAFFGEEAEMINPLKNLISNMLRNAVLLYIGYRLLLAFIKWAPVLASGLAALFRKLFSAPKSGSEFESSDYSDEIETVRPVREHDRRKQLRKKMKISFRALKGISDPVERVRYMYAALLTLLPSIGIKTEQSDTTSEILKKAAVSPVISGELSPFTQVYNQVRYGEVIPDGSMLASAEEHFNKAVEGFGQK